MEASFVVLRAWHCIQAGMWREEGSMFGIFRRDPVRKLRAQYVKQLEVARDLQRKGDIKGFAAATAEAEAMARRLDRVSKPDLG